MATWQVQQAKSRLSELMEDAWSKGPQIITKHGTKNVAVISIDDYESFISSRVGPKDTAKEYLLSGPKFAREDFAVPRAVDSLRNIDFLFEDDDL